jgi:hypothetical protein
MHDIRGWIALVALLLFTIILFWVGQARAQPLPLPKQGQCSGGYEQSGSYCVPKNATRGGTEDRVQEK